MEDGRTKWIDFERTFSGPCFCFLCKWTKLVPIYRLCDHTNLCQTVMPVGHNKHVKEILLGKDREFAMKLSLNSLIHHVLPPFNLKKKTVFESPIFFEQCTSLFGVLAVSWDLNHSILAGVNTGISPEVSIEEQYSLLEKTFCFLLMSLIRTITN